MACHDPFLGREGEVIVRSYNFRCYEWKLDTLPLDRSVSRRNRYTPKFAKNRRQYNPDRGQDDSRLPIDPIGGAGGVAATAVRNSSGPEVRRRDTTRNQPPRAMMAPNGATGINCG
jgi:hypothetical protein